jgi:hypothetical protein
MIRENRMTQGTSNAKGRNILFAVIAAVLFCLLGIPSQARPGPKQSSVAPSSPGPKLFGTPKEAVEALTQAAADFNVPTLLEILGPDGKDLVASEDRVEDRNRAVAFAAKAKERNRLITNAKNPNRAILTVGDEDWPLPIPLVKKNGEWYFDSKAGLDEILRRRIGANELDTITVCRGYVEAQLAYAAEIHNDSGVNQYAQKIISTPGKHDGLAWRNPDGTWGGPVGERVAEAIDRRTMEQGKPFHGYYFKILKGQGSAARLGELDYVINGAMIGGFALLAFPAEYRVTGVQTFIVSYDGVVYQKDLGPDTVRMASAMERYDPDSSWRRTDDNW